MLDNWKVFKLTELYDISSGLSKSAEEFGFGFPFLSFSTVFNKPTCKYFQTRANNLFYKERRCVLN